MMIDLYTTEKGGKQTIVHDLNFQAPQYENVHTVTFRNPSQALQAILRETGPLPTDEERKLKKGEAKNKRKNWDMDKIADALVKLGEDDLLHVIQMVHDHKDEHTYILNNVDQGEFSVDLYSLPENLLKMLSDFLVRLSLVISCYFGHLANQIVHGTTDQQGCLARLKHSLTAFLHSLGVWRLG
jgi:transcription initiation factor IIF auxiliary subunit